jgi:hypothetical protein
VPAAERNDRRFGHSGPAQRPADFPAVHIRQTNIKQYGVKRAYFRGFNCASAIACSFHFEAIVQLQLFR